MKEIKTEIIVNAAPEKARYQYQV